MKYTDFVEWMNNNCPDGIDHEDMIDFLASRAAMIIDEGAKNRGISSSEMLSGFLSGAFEAFLH